MQINVALDENNVNQAKTIREAWYPNTTVRQTRDAFIFNDALDRFGGKAEDLLPIIEKEDGKSTVQRMLTIKADSNERLKTIAASIEKSIAATYRAIISYTIGSLGDVAIETKEVKTEIRATQLVKEKVLLLEKQLAACNQTMEEIKKILEEE